MLKNNCYSNTFDLFEITEAKKKRARQAVIMQTWANLAGIDYSVYDYDAWLTDLDAEEIEIEKEIVADAVENVKAVQARFNHACEERRRLRRVK